MKWERNVPVILFLVFVATAGFGIYKLQNTAQAKSDSELVTYWIDGAVASSCEVMPEDRMLAMASVAQVASLVDRYLAERGQSSTIPGKFTYVPLPPKTGQSVFTLKFTGDDKGYGPEFARQLSSLEVDSTWDLAVDKETCGNARLRAKARSEKALTPKKYAPLWIPR